MAFLDHHALMIVVSVFVGITILASNAARHQESGTFRLAGLTSVAAMLTQALGYLARSDDKFAVVFAVMLFGFLSVSSRLQDLARTGFTRSEMSTVLIPRLAPS